MTRLSWKTAVKTKAMLVVANTEKNCYICNNKQSAIISTMQLFCYKNT